MWVSLDRPDAHLAAKLEVFGEDGVEVAHGRVVGLRSMQHLEPLVANRFQQEQPVLPPVGVPVRVSLRFQPTDLVVPKGGRLRLTVAGSVIVFEGLDQIRRGAGIIFRGPSQPSGSATRVTVHHDCAHRSALRFLMPDAEPDLLNVREDDESADQPLPDNHVVAPPVSDAGGLATTPICGHRPLDPQALTEKGGDDDDHGDDENFRPRHLKRPSRDGLRIGRCVSSLLDSSGEPTSGRRWRSCS